MNDNEKKIELFRSAMASIDNLLRHLDSVHATISGPSDEEQGAMQELRDRQEEVARCYNAVGRHLHAALLARPDSIL